MCVNVDFFYICSVVYSNVGVLPSSGWEEVGVCRAGRGGLRLRAPGFGSCRAQLRASAPVWNGHAGRTSCCVSLTHLTHYRTLVVSDLQIAVPLLPHSSA